LELAVAEELTLLAFGAVIERELGVRIEAWWSAELSGVLSRAWLTKPSCDDAVDGLCWWRWRSDWQCVSPGVTIARAVSGSSGWSSVYARYCGGGHAVCVTRWRFEKKLSSVSFNPSGAQVIMISRRATAAIGGG